MFSDVMSWLAFVVVILVGFSACLFLSTQAVFANSKDLLNQACLESKFGNIERSFFSSFNHLFWTMLAEPDDGGIFDCFNDQQLGWHSYIFIWVLYATYSIMTIIVLVNLLIAMMSKTHEDVNDKVELQFNFYYVDVWLRFIRRDFVAPPPVTCLPNFRSKLWKRIYRACCGRICQRTAEIDVEQEVLQLDQIDSKDQEIQVAAKMAAPMPSEAIIDDFPTVYSKSVYDNDDTTNVGFALQAKNVYSLNRLNSHRYLDSDDEESFLRNRKMIKKKRIFGHKLKSLVRKAKPEAVPGAHTYQDSDMSEADEPKLQPYGTSYDDKENIETLGQGEATSDFDKNKNYHTQVDQMVEKWRLEYLD